MRSVVRWNRDEMDAVAREMARIRLGADPYVASMSTLQLARKAQIALPADRRRDIPHKQALSPWIVSHYETLVKLKASQPKEPEAPPPPPAKTEREILEDFLVGVVVKAAIRLAQNPAISALIQGAMPQDVRTAAAPIVLPQGNGKHNPGPFQEAKDRGPVVLIVGLKHHRRAAFESTFHGKLRMKFWCDEAPDLLRAKVAGSDRVYALMGSISHGMVDLMQRAGAGDRLVRVTGGDTELRGLLEQFLARQAQAAKP